MKRPFIVTCIVLSAFAVVFSIINFNDNYLSGYLLLNSLLFLTLSICLFFKKADMFKKILFTILIVFNLLYSAKVLTSKVFNESTFLNKSYLEVYSWAKDKKVELNESYEYSDNVKKDKIISEIINKDYNGNIKSLNVVVSIGPNYEKKIFLPDLYKWDDNNVVKFLDSNYIRNVNIIYKRQKYCHENTIMDQSKNGIIKRNEGFNLTLCLRENIEPFTLKDLTNSTKSSALVYLLSNGIKVNIKEEFSNVVEQGKVIRTDRKVNSNLKENDELVLYVSKGKKIYTIDFKKKTKDEIIKWILNNNLNIAFIEEYNSKVKKDEIIRTNVDSNEFVSEGDVIKIFISKGKIQIPEFKDINELKKWTKENTFEYEIKYIESKEILSGGIIDVKKKDKKLIVYVSKEKLNFVPDFDGKTEDESRELCEKNKIDCIFKYETATKSDECISQSVKKYKNIPDGTKVILTITKKDKTKSEFGLITE